ncbi:MAG: wax ester/triacylglycerol synthase family O-acyltransferase [Burkholderiales bacterium]|nr:MAG: wax ester/triacylglycerol synthase family O-acyltransferase [Burkholderiales bacterium]
MSSVDLAWLRMDSPHNLMQIVAVHVLRQRLDYERVSRMLASPRLMRFRRFRQRVEFDMTGGAHWVDDEDFDIARHLVRTRLPRGSGAAAERLKQFTAKLAAEPLDPARPLWQFHLVEDYDGGSALVQRIHHCIADGIALIGVLLELTDRGATTGPEAPAEETHRLESNPWKPYLEPLTRGAVRAIATGERAWTRGIELLAEPQRALDYLRAGNRLVGDAMQILLMDDDSPTPLKGVPGVAKRTAWNEPLPLDEVKAVARVLRASVNDVLLACVAGALRHYLRAAGADTHGTEVRALVPVNLRPPSDGGALGNRFGLVPLVLPVGIASPLARVREVHRRMDELKAGYQAVLGYTLLAAVGMAPRAVQTPILEYLANKASAVMTNVPGPQQPLYFAGSEIERMMFWVPQSGNIGLGVSILSYNGGVQFGIVSDAGLTPEPQRIIDGFGREFELLVHCLMLMPPELVMAEDFDPVAIEQLLFHSVAHGKRSRRRARRR